MHERDKSLQKKIDKKVLNIYIFFSSFRYVCAFIKSKYFLYFVLLFVCHSWPFIKKKCFIKTICTFAPGQYWAFKSDSFPCPPCVTNSTVAVITRGFPGSTSSWLSSTLHCSFKTINSGQRQGLTTKRDAKGMDLSGQFHPMWPPGPYELNIPTNSQQLLKHQWLHCPDLWFLI